MEFKKLIIVCGHYGCGKTNLCINLAKTLKERGEQVALVDLDIVNPYFRTSDYRSYLDRKGINLVVSPFASGNLDIPALPAELYGVFNREGTVIIDVGGDDAGAAALGRFSHMIRERDHEFIYVINQYRALTDNVSDTVALLRDIENISRVKATSIVNNSHLGELTTLEDIEKTQAYADEIARETDLPLLFTTAPTDLVKGREDRYFSVDIVVKAPWK